MYVNYFFMNFTCKTKESQCFCLSFLMLTLKKFYFVRHLHAHDFSTPVLSLSFWEVNICKTCWGTEVVNSFFPCIARLWNSVPAYCFPLSYNLHLFKANISMHLVSLIITWKPTNKNIGNFISCLKSKLINWFEKWCPFLTYLISYEVTVAATVYILALYCNTQSFIQAPLSVVVFPQRFSFFTVYLVQWLRGLAPWWIPKGSLFEFTSADCCKTHFS